MKSQMETERLLLRMPVRSDAAALFKLRMHPEVNRFIQRKTYMGVSDVELFIADRNIDFDNGVYYVICDKQDQSLIGSICLWNRNVEENYAELGYELLPDYQKKGLMSEAVSEILKLASEELGIITVEAFTHSLNVNSRKMLERFNFQLQVGRTDEDNVNNVIYQILLK